jgi:hypothetical protein
MPSENTFKAQVEVARTALKNFNAIRQLDAPGPNKAAFDELVSSVEVFQNFVPFFVNHPLFQEIPVAAHTALEEFLSTHPNFEKPTGYARVLGLNARIRETTRSSARKGISSFFEVINLP